MIHKFTGSTRRILACFLRLERFISRQPSHVFIQGAIATPLMAFIFLAFINLLAKLSDFIWYASLAYAALLLALGLGLGIGRAINRAIR